MRMMATIVYLVVVLAVASANTAQYYQPLNPNSFELGYNPSGDEAAAAADSNFIEKKFVNSGQSIVLICDLPNNMPDGKVGIYFRVEFLRVAFQWVLICMFSYE